MENTTVSVRVPEPYAEAFENASRRVGVFRSELLRRALRYYTEQNPDEIGTFHQFEQGDREKNWTYLTNPDLTTSDER